MKDVPEIWESRPAKFAILATGVPFTVLLRRDGRLYRWSTAVELRERVHGLPAEARRTARVTVEPGEPIVVSTLPTIRRRPWRRS